MYLRLLRELKGVDAVGEVGGERVVQLAQRLLQRLERLLVLLQSLQLLLEADLPVHRLQDIKSTDCMFHKIYTFWRSLITQLTSCPESVNGKG